MDDTDAVTEVARRLEIDTDGVHPDVVVNKVFEETFEERWSDRFSSSITPPASAPDQRKATIPNRRTIRTVHPGMELANAYTELNDPLLQDELFRPLDGLDEKDSMAKLDTDFLEALRFGMPPAGEWGRNRPPGDAADRQPFDPDVIFFPLLKPESVGGGKSAPSDNDKNTQPKQQRQTRRIGELSDGSIDGETGFSHNGKGLPCKAPALPPLSADPLDRDGQHRQRDARRGHHDRGQQVMAGFAPRCGNGSTESWPTSSSKPNADGDPDAAARMQEIQEVAGN
ncbi:MAG: hypothetical protein Ct9H300mP1_10700 [Planctomycetaceae bacterium]|nr:MAG: hypothetical protein Ct9H300mP1_10700 [Planctomycetaceae bacterium]